MVTVRKWSNVLSMFATTLPLFKMNYWSTPTKKCISSHSFCLYWGLSVSHLDTKPFGSCRPIISPQLSANKERVPVGAYQPFLLSYKNNQWQCPFHPAGLSRPATWHPTLIPMLASELAVLLLSLATLTSVSILVVAKLATRTPATQAHLNMALELDSLWWVSFVLSD